MRIKENKNLAVAGLAVLAIILLYALSLISDSENSSAHILIEGKRVNVEVAQSIEQRAKGLSARAHLPDEKGMLFLFDEPDRHTFWMKGMQFGLDFIWIRDEEIVDVHYDIPPPEQDSGNLPVYSPREPADMVLEVNAGWIRKNFGNENIVGKKIEIEGLN